MAGGGEPLEPPPGGDEQEDEHEEHGDDDDEEEEDVGAAAVERRQAAMQPEPSGTHQTPVLRNCSNPCSVQLCFSGKSSDSLCGCSQLRSGWGRQASLKKSSTSRAPEVRTMPPSS